MEALQEAERALSGVHRYVASNLSPHGSSSSSSLSFSADEEQALEEKVSDSIAAYQRALSSAQDWIQELQDPKEAKEATQTLEKHQKQLQSHVAGCRKALVAYRQRAKIERLEQQRKSLLPKTPAEGKTTSSSSSSAASGSAVDVTAALKRTRQVMSQEIERVSSVTKVLDDGRLSLRSSHEEYGSVNAEIAEVRKRLKALEWQARQDKMWIGAGIAVLVSTVLFIVYERTGLVWI